MTFAEGSPCLAHTWVGISPLQTPTLQAQDIHNVCKTLAHEALWLKPEQGGRSAGAEHSLHNPLGVDLHDKATLIQGLHVVDIAKVSARSSTRARLGHVYIAKGPSFSFAQEGFCFFPSVSTQAQGQAARLSRLD
jgi:hypothetical protein